MQRRDLTVLCAATATASTATTMLVLAVPLVALAQGVSPSGVGLVVSTAFVAPLFLALPLGRLVDRVGARRILLTGQGVFLLALVPSIMSGSLTALIVTYVVATLGQLGTVVASQSMVADLARAAGREVAYGWWTTSVAIGQFVGPLFAGFLIDTYGGGSPFVGALACVAVAFGLSNAVRAGRDPSNGATRNVEAPAPLGQSLRTRTVVVAILTSSAALWAMAVFSTYFPVRMTALGVSATVIGSLVSLRAAASIAIRPFMAVAVRGLGGRSNAVVLTLVGLGTGLFLLAGTKSMVAIAAVCVLFGLASGLSQPVSMVMVADAVEPRLRGAVLGVRLTGNRLAQLLAPVALVPLLDAAGLPALFVGHGLIVGVLALTLLVVLRGARGRGT